MSSRLTEAAAHLDDAVGALTRHNPLWHAISSLAIDESHSGLDLVFASQGRRDLFLEALLATYSVTEVDLRSINVGTFSFKDFENVFATNGSAPEVNERRAVIVGNVGRSDERRLQALLSRRNIGVLIYPHQARLLQDRARHWARSTALDFNSVAKLGVVVPTVAPKVPDRIALADPLFVQTSAFAAPPPPGWLSEWVDPDPEHELQILHDSSEELMDSYAEENAPVGDESPSTDREPSSLVCAQAIFVSFESGWQALYAPDQELMFVRRLGHRVRTDVRNADELEPGLEIVAIHGQRRQSLYDLLVTRLHGNPAIALQLALVREWQRELASSYEIWTRRTGNNLESFLDQLQAAGSAITSTLAVRFWIAGRTLAPIDPEDMRRVAELLSMDFVKKHHRRIYAAASRLRGLHRGLANRLTNWLEREVTQTSVIDDSPIDAELGLRFSDFASTLLHLTVDSVEVREGPFLRARLGDLEQGRPSE